MDDDDPYRDLVREQEQIWAQEREDRKLDYYDED